MTIFPLADGARMLGIHPKTLHHWLTQAQMPVHAHPTDARLKCVTWQQVQHLAALHARPLPSSATAGPALPHGAPAQASSEGQATPSLSCERAHLPATPPFLPAFPPEADLTHKLFFLERSVTTMQEQLTQLALAVLQERSERFEQRITALEALLQQAVAGPAPLQAPPTTTSGGQPEDPPPGERRLVPAELRARSRVTALIEYGAQGQYVAVCPQLGVLSLTPDSPAWFDWLASLTSFRFVGPAGRFSACRASHRGQHTRCWAARRWVHGHDFWHYLGVTDRLTLVSLEQAAAALQARVDTL